jgi:hypothetical protein
MPYSNAIDWSSGAAKYRSGSTFRASTGCCIRIPQSDPECGSETGVLIESRNTQYYVGSAAIGIPVSQIPEVVGMLMDAYQAALNEQHQVYTLEKAPVDGE